METALINIVLNDTQLKTDSGEISVLVLSAAFDTVDHRISFEKVDRNLHINVQ